jgi:hypothetical protein
MSGRGSSSAHSVGRLVAAPGPPALLRTLELAERPIVGTAYFFVSATVGGVVVVLAVAHALTVPPILEAGAMAALLVWGHRERPRLVRATAPWLVRAFFGFSLAAMIHRVHRDDLLWWFCLAVVMLLVVEMFGMLCESRALTPSRRVPRVPDVDLVRPRRMDYVLAVLMGAACGLVVGLISAMLVVSSGGVIWAALASIIGGFGILASAGLTAGALADPTLPRGEVMRRLSRRPGTRYRRRWWLDTYVLRSTQVRVWLPWTPLALSALQRLDHELSGARRQRHDRRSRDRRPPSR